MDLHLPNSQTLTITPEDESYRIRRIMGENTLTLKWKTTEFLEIPTGTYVTFQGVRYTLYSPENFKKKGTRIYEYTLLLETYQAIARRFRVKDATGKTKFNFTGTPKDLLDLFVWNMNQRDSGWTRGSYIEAEPKLIAFDGNTVIEGVQMGADLFGTEFAFDGKTISYGKVEFNKSTPLALSYGKGNGLRPGVGRENASDADAFEILNVQGSDRNIDASKYGNDVLLLPKSQTIGYDGSKFSDETGFVSTGARYYVTDADGLTVRRSDKALSTYAEACFDGTKIYPTILHTILKVETETETIDDEEVTFYNVIIDAVEALDYRDCQIAGETATVIFQSGMLTGREFSLETKADGTLDIEKYSENGSFVGWRLKLCQDEQDGYVMPGGSFIPAVNGTLKVFGVQLPAAYICDNTSKTGASWQMFRDAVRFMFDNEDPKYTFSGELDDQFSKANWANIGPKIVPGGYVSFSDSQFLPDGALIRIVGIREGVNDPYSPTLELSNGTVHGSFASQMAALENTENKIEAAKADTIAYTRRSWQAAKETQAMLEKALLQEFTTTISPISINTMQMLVGSESLQYGWIQSLTNDTIVDHHLSFDSNGNLVCPAGYIKHYEMGITDVQPNKAITSFMRWSVAAATKAFSDDAKAYYLYIKAEKLNGAGTGSATFVLSEDPIGLEDVTGYWHFLYATIGSVMDGERSIFTCNGFTEIGPGRITAYKFISPDGLQYLDFLTKAFRVGDNNRSIAYDTTNGVVLYGVMTQSPSGDKFPTPCFRGAYISNVSYYYGDEVTYNGESWLHTGNSTTNGVAPGTDANVWTKKSAKGTDGTPGSFKSIVFKRAATQPAKPTTGSYDSPVPTGWSDGIPEPATGQTIETPVWMTACIFTYGSSASPAWEDVRQITDTADIDFEFSAVETNPGNPTDNAANWHDTATSSDIWMAVRKGRNGVWETTPAATKGWEITKIKGEKGADGNPGSAGAAAKLVSIMASSLVFSYANDESGTEPNEASITLTAKVENITETTYLWEYRRAGASNWTTISGATTNTLTIPKSSISTYFDTQKVCEFRVTIDSRQDTVSISRIYGGTNAISAFLSNTSHLFAAGTSAAVAGSDTFTVLAYRGLTAVTPTIGNITGAPTGMSVTKDGAQITVEVTTSLTQASGILTIPVTVSGTTINLYYSWSLSKTGATGAWPRGLNEWKPNTQYYSGAPGEEIRDYVFYGNNKYRCLTTHVSRSTFDATEESFWSQAVDMDFIAAKAMSVDDAFIQNLIVNMLRTKNPVNEKAVIQVTENQMTVANSSGKDMIKIHTGSLSSGSGSGSYSLSGAKSATVYDPSGSRQGTETLSFGSITISGENNIVTTSAFTCAMSLSNQASGLQEVWARFTLKYGNVVVGTGVVTKQGSTYSFTMPSMQITRPVGTYSITMEIQYRFYSSNSGTIAVFTGTPASASGSISYTEEIAEMATDGFRFRYGTEGFAADGTNGARVIRGGTAYPALAGDVYLASGESGLVAPVKLVICKTYPSTLEPNAFYLKVS